MLGRVALCLSLVASLAPAAAAGRAGVMVDAGVPDGLVGSLVYRPAGWLQLQAGAGTNLIAVGVRAGASLILLPTAVAPSLTGEIGHYPAGDATAMAAGLGVDPGGAAPVLRQLGYDYASLHVGLELGRERWSVSLHAGVSEIRGAVHGLDQVIGQPGDGLSIQLRGQPTATLITPSARLGLALFF